jgi:hypothetical protein
MNKRQLVDQIIDSLSVSLSSLQKAARASHAEATHESSKPENKYDTRGLEAAYLAGGQARQAAELLDSINTYRSLELRDFGPGEPVDISALVKLKSNEMEFTYFVGPRNGGLEIIFGNDEITVITPQSPLGQNVVGRTEGQRWIAKIGGSTVKYQLVSVL